MKKIHDSKFMEISFYPEKLLMISKFKPNEMLEENFKQELLTFLEKAKLFRPKKALWNLSQFEFTIAPELQEWVDEKINKEEVSLGITKEAFVVSADLVSHLSVEQSMDETHGKKLKVKYFDSEGEALAWLEI